MIKRSNLFVPLSESCRWWDCNSRALGEWTYEGGRKLRQVVPDGNRTRYPDGLYNRTVSEWTILSSIWVVSQDFQVLSHNIGDKAFSFARKSVKERLGTYLDGYIGLDEMRVEKKFR